MEVKELKVCGVIDTITLNPIDIKPRRSEILTGRESFGYGLSESL